MNVPAKIVGIFPFVIYIETAHGIEEISATKFRKPDELRHGDTVRMTKDRQGWQVVDSNGDVMHPGP